MWIIDLPKVSRVKTRKKSSDDEKEWMTESVFVIIIWTKLVQFLFFSWFFLLKLRQLNWFSYITVLCLFLRRICIPLLGQDSQLPSSNNYPLTLALSSRLIFQNLLQFQNERWVGSHKAIKNEYSFLKLGQVLKRPALLKSSGKRDQYYFTLC